MNLDEDEMNAPTEQFEKDAITTKRLTQSWNGFTNIESSDVRNTKLEVQKQTVSIAKNTNSFSSTERITHKKRNKQSHRPNYKAIKMPTSFPGVKTVYTEPKQEEKPTIVETEQEEAKLSMDDLQKVLTPRRERIPGIKHRGEKLPRIKITETKHEVPNESKSDTASPRGGSHYFNCARMMTELNDVCRMKTVGVAGHGKSEENLLRPKTVHEARRYSSFTPRGSRDRPHHTRRRSLPNLSTREFPKRFFVKLDPLRASAMQVNLGSFNETSRRCRVVSENLNKLDKQGIELGEQERKVMIGQWIRETSQLDYKDNHVITEVEPT